MPSKPTVPPARPEIPSRRMVDLPGAPRRADGRPETEGKKLIVGRDISLSGNITACERLIVEGSVEANLTDAVAIEVSETGMFKGSAEVEEAEIGGHFEGGLTVRKKLTVRSTGRIQGTVRYGRLVIELGGEVSGTVEVLPADEQPAPRQPAAPAFRAPDSEA